MATDLQIKKFQENPDCIELATIMTSTIYPRIIQLLSQLGMREVRIEKIPGLKTFCITLEGTIEFFTIVNDGKKERKDNLYKVDFSKENICAYFSNPNNVNASITESATEEYVQFCTHIMKCIAPLEERVSKVKEAIKIAQRFTIPLTRNVLIEKFHGEKDIK